MTATWTSPSQRQPCKSPPYGTLHAEHAFDAPRAGCFQSLRSRHGSIFATHCARSPHLWLFVIRDYWTNIWNLVCHLLGMRVFIILTKKKHSQHFGGLLSQAALQNADITPLHLTLNTTFMCFASWIKQSENSPMIMSALCHSSISAGSDNRAAKQDSRIRHARAAHHSEVEVVHICSWWEEKLEIKPILLLVSKIKRVENKTVNSEFVT